MLLMDSGRSGVCGVASATDKTFQQVKFTTLFLLNQSATCESRANQITLHHQPGALRWSSRSANSEMTMAEQKKERKTPTGIPTTKEKQDEAIIGTNDYSIVSKRSMEKIYYSDEPEFLRPFVGKFKRRAPLINRGYWLRMKAIEQVVKHFLDENTGKRKAIINLGCGYEPLPFRMLWKYSNQCRGVRFIDVDYPQLIRKKVDIIRKNNIFFDLLDGDGLNSLPDPSSSIYMNDDKYCAIGCDLGDTETLDSILKTELQFHNHSILFIGEVSIVYMEVEKADELIKWTSTFEDGVYLTLVPRYETLDLTSI
jgi:tRNA wybutosine-synthesizing protein 4